MPSNAHLKDLPPKLDVETVALLLGRCRRLLTYDRAANRGLAWTMERGPNRRWRIVYDREAVLAEKRRLEKGSSPPTEKQMEAISA